MSYILDALRKAESDRKLGDMVGVHDPSPMPAPTLVAQASPWQRWLPAVALAGLMVSGLTLAWLMRGEGSTDGPTPEAFAASATSTTETTPPVTPTPNASPSHSNVAVVQIPQPAAHAKQAPETTLRSNEPSTKSPAMPLAADGPVRLTPDLRANLPPLAVGGAMYSDTPASRMVVINGQLFHEGDTVAPEVVLEAVQLKSAIIRYRGQRYLLDY